MRNILVVCTKGCLKYFDMKMKSDFCFVGEILCGPEMDTALKYLAMKLAC